MAKLKMVLISNEAHTALKDYCSKNTLTLTKTVSQFILDSIQRSEEEKTKVEFKPATDYNPPVAL